jgi:hypothetical protein
VKLKDVLPGESIWLSGKELARGESEELSNKHWGERAEIEVRWVDGSSENVSVDLVPPGGIEGLVVLGGCAIGVARDRLDQWSRYLEHGLARELEAMLLPPVISLALLPPSREHPGWPRAQAVRGGPPGERLRVTGKDVGAEPVELNGSLWGGDITYEAVNTSGVEFRRELRLGLLELLAPLTASGVYANASRQMLMDIRNKWANFLAPNYIAMLDEMISPASVLVVAPNHPDWPSVLAKELRHGGSVWLSGRELDGLACGEEVRLVGIPWGEKVEFEIRKANGGRATNAVLIVPDTGMADLIALAGCDEAQARKRLKEWSPYLGATASLECGRMLEPPAVSLAIQPPAQGSVGWPKVRPAHGKAGEGVVFKGKAVLTDGLILTGCRWGETVAFEVTNAKGVRFGREVKLDLLPDLWRAIGVDNNTKVADMKKIQGAWLSVLGPDYLVMVNQRIEDMLRFSSGACLVVVFDPQKPARPWCDLRGISVGDKIEILMQGVAWGGRNTELPKDLRWGATLDYVVVNRYGAETPRKLVLDPTNKVEEVFELTKDMQWMAICRRWVDYGMVGAPRSALVEVLKNRAGADLGALLNEYISTGKASDVHGLSLAAKDAPELLASVAGLNSKALSELLGKIESLVKDTGADPLTTVAASKQLRSCAESLEATLRAGIPERCWGILANTLVRQGTAVAKAPRGKDWSGWGYISCLSDVDKLWDGRARGDANLMGVAALLFGGAPDPICMVGKGSVHWKSVEDLGLTQIVYSSLSKRNTQRIAEIRSVKEALIFLQGLDQVEAGGHRAEAFWDVRHADAWMRAINKFGDLKELRYELISGNGQDPVRVIAALRRKLHPPWWKPVTDLVVADLEEEIRLKVVMDEIAGLDQGIKEATNATALLQWFSQADGIRKMWSDNKRLSTLWDANGPKWVTGSFEIAMNHAEMDAFGTVLAGLCDPYVREVGKVAMGKIASRFWKARKASYGDGVKATDAGSNAFMAKDWGDAAAGFRDAASRFWEMVADFGPEFEASAKVCDFNGVLCELKIAGSKPNELVQAILKQQAKLEKISEGLPAECGDLILMSASIRKSVPRTGTEEMFARTRLKALLEKHKEPVSLPVLPGFQ